MPTRPRFTERRPAQGSRRFAEIQEFGHTNAVHEVAKHDTGLEMVVLSHVG